MNLRIVDRKITIREEVIMMSRTMIRTMEIMNKTSTSMRKKTNIINPKCNKISNKEELNQILIIITRGSNLNPLNSNNKLHKLKILTFSKGWELGLLTIMQHLFKTPFLSPCRITNLTISVVLQNLEI